MRASAQMERLTDAVITDSRSLPSATSGASQTLELFRHALTPRDRGELSSLTAEMRPIDLRPLASDHALRVFDVARESREQLVKYEILGRRERYRQLSQLYLDRPLDRLTLVRSGRED